MSDAVANVLPVPDSPVAQPTPFKIGLALSGGGFRASIFHLGVIRRLEELGIMPKVEVISSVSGGSIIAAYYVCEMERRLRARWAAYRRDPAGVRLGIFEEIAAGFFKALDHNLRTRALLFSPFYHPLLFARSLWPGYSRSDLIQEEYNRWFYHGDTLDELPSVTHDRVAEEGGFLAGPKLALNTTSLLTGRRVAFSREPLSRVNEMSKVNTNVLPLARIVGASAGVPGLFPPTSVCGDVLVDGGVSDNQGIEALMEEKCNMLIISDASGQMEQVDTQKTSELPVLLRTSSIQSFQIRSKLVERLIEWKHADRRNHQFAFVHLFLNLKDRPSVLDRVPSEYIPSLGRIRTDLDQFSFIEREALMYHGYTLVDAQLKKHTELFLRQEVGEIERLPALRVPPLFTGAAEVLASGGEEPPPAPPAAKGRPAGQPAFEDRRDRIRRELEAGSRGMLLARTFKKYRWKAGLVSVACLAPLAAGFGTAFQQLRGLAEPAVAAWMASWTRCSALGWLSTLSGWTEGYFSSPVSPRGLTSLLLAALMIYILLLVLYGIMRRLVVRWDRKSYRELTGVADPGTRW